MEKPLGNQGRGIDSPIRASRESNLSGPILVRGPVTGNDAETERPERVSRGGMSESDIQKLILEYLTRRYPDAWVERIPAQGIKRGRGGMAKSPLRGCPDILMFREDLGLIGFEVKVKSGKVSPEQHKYHARIEKAGGRVFIVRAVDDVVTAMGTK